MQPAHSGYLGGSEPFPEALQGITMRASARMGLVFSPGV